MRKGDKTKVTIGSEALDATYLDSIGDNIVCRIDEKPKHTKEHKYRLNDFVEFSLEKYGKFRRWEPVRRIGNTDEP